MTTPAGSVTEAPARPPRHDVRLRPVQQPSWRRVIAAVLALFLPIFGTAFAVAVGSAADTRPLLAATLLTTVLVIALALRFARAGLVLHGHGFTEYGILATARFVPSERVASASIVKLYDAQTLQTWNQLFLLDAAGRTLLRLRGRFWSDDQIRVVARHVGGPIDLVAEPLTLAELRRGRRSQLYWYERHPLLNLIMLSAVGVLVAFTIAAAVTASMPPLSPR